jgi:TonB family protein
VFSVVRPQGPAARSDQRYPAATAERKPRNIAKVTTEKFDPSALSSGPATRRNTTLQSDELPPAFAGVSTPPVVAQNVLPVGPPVSIAAPPLPAREEGTRPPERIRVGGNFEAPKLISAPPPQIPPLAKERRIFGTVKLQATINKEGMVTELTVLSGHPFLVTAAREAAAKWRYRPATLDGDAIDVKLPIQIVFQPSQ